MRNRIRNFLASQAESEAFNALTGQDLLEEIREERQREFLGEGMKVKVAVFIKGRMMQRMDIVKQTLQDFLEMVKDYAAPDKQPELMGRDYSVMLSPIKKTGGNQHA